MRLFEGIEASGYGVCAVVKRSLFPESFGGVLVEVSTNGADILFSNEYKELLNPVYVGLIISEKKLDVDGITLDWNKLYNAWNNKFRKEVLAA